MPTNGFADGILYTVNGAPVFTYGMITLTAVVLAYVTFIEAPDVPIEPNPIVASIPQASIIPQIPTISNPVAPLPVSSSPDQTSLVPSSAFPSSPVPSSPDQTSLVPSSAFPSSPVSSSPDQTSIIPSSPVSSSPVSSSPDQTSLIPSSAVPSTEQKAQGGKKVKRRKTRRRR